MTFSTFFVVGAWFIFKDEGAGAFWRSAPAPGGGTVAEIGRGQAFDATSREWVDWFRLAPT